MDWPGMRQMYLAILSGEGFRPEIDRDGDVHFKYEGGHYYITRNSDTTCVHILYPGFWPIESSAELAAAFVAANAATREVKVSKVYVNNEGSNVSASMESFFADQRDVGRFLSRGLLSMRTAVETFKKELRSSMVN